MKRHLNFTLPRKSVTTLLKQKRLRWAGRVAHMDAMGVIYIMLLRKRLRQETTGEGLDIVTIILKSVLYK
jgi:hypothetical protein